MTLRLRALAPVVGAGVAAVMALSLASAEATESVGIPPDAANPPASATALAVVPPRLEGKVWTRIPTSKKVVALTFDCGAGAAGVRSIMRTLSDKTVRRATFFMTGTWVNTYPRAARRIATRGFTIGNHSMTHPDFTTLTPRGVQRQLARAERAITATTGASPRPWFRFPYGGNDPTIVRQVNDLGWVPIGWTVDTLGWQGTSGGQSVDSVVRRVTSAAAPGEIVLMHVGANPDDHSTLDADALPTIIARLRHKGYHFVSVNALLR